MNDKMTYRQRDSLWIINYENANMKAELAADRGENSYILDLSITKVKPNDDVLMSMVLQMVYRISKTHIKKIILNFDNDRCSHLEQSLSDYGFRIINRTSDLIMMDKVLGQWNEMFDENYNFPEFPMDFQFGENKSFVYKLPHTIQDKTFFTPPTFSQKGDVKVFFLNQFRFNKIIPSIRKDVKKGDIVLFMRTVPWNGLYNDEITTIATVTKVHSDIKSLSAYKKRFNKSVSISSKTIESMYNAGYPLIDILVNERFAKKDRINKHWLQRKDILKSSVSIPNNNLTSNNLKYIINYCKTKNNKL